MSEVIELNTEQKAALFTHGPGEEQRPAGAWLALAVPSGVAPAAVATQIAQLLDDMAARTAVSATLQAAATLPPPATMRALLDREVALREVDKKYGLLRSDRLANLRGSKSKNPSEYASAMRRDGKVVGLTRAGRTVFPAYQFSDNGNPIPELVSIIQTFRQAEWSDESIVLWFTAPNGYLNDAAPADVLASDPASVAAAAASAGADW